MNKARRLLGTIFVSALLILIGIAASPDECFAAEDDIASGTYDDVPWAITSDYTLQIGDGGEYTFTNNLSRNSESYPWHENIYNIKSVEVLGTVHGYGSFSGMFYSFQGCSNMDLSGLDTSNVTDMSGMFRFCESVRELDLSSFDTTDVENMSEMFRACNCLKSLKLSGEFDTTNVKDMSIMFDNCMALESLDLSGFNTSSAENMNSMFSGCTGLITLTTPDWSNPTATLPTFPVKMYNKTTVRFSREDRKAQLYAVAINVSARAHNDPDFIKLQRVQKIRRVLKRKLRKKYHAEAVRRMKVYFKRLQSSKSPVLSAIGKKLEK